MRAYGFVDWSGNAGFKFAEGSSSYLALALVSADDYNGLRQALLKTRIRLGLPNELEFHFAHNADPVRSAFFSGLPDVHWEGAVLLVDKRSLPVRFTRMAAPALYSSCLEYLLARVPASLIKIERLLIDGKKKEQVFTRTMRVAMSCALHTRGIEHTPTLRSEPAHQWDGLQLADMLAGAVLERALGGKNYLREVEKRLRIYQHQAIN